MVNPAKIVVLMGVSGSGKTTVGKLLAERLGWPFQDADDFHPEANRLKMHQGIPLTDRDREPWLQSLANLLDDKNEYFQPYDGGHAPMRGASRELLLRIGYTRPM